MANLTKARLAALGRAKTLAMAPHCPPILSLVAAVLLAGCGAIFGPIDPDDQEEVRFTVPKGATARGLGPPLEEAGVTSASRWRLFLKLDGGGSCVKAGDFNLSRAMSMEEILARLCGAPLSDDVPFTVVEGWRIREIDAALASSGLAAPGDYAAWAERPGEFAAPFNLELDSLEGYLFPETYMVSPSGFTVEGFIQRQLDALADRFWTDKRRSVQTRPLHDLVIMASMLEREEPDPAWRPTVAGILWKRIDNGWNLGVDATSRYNLDDWNDRRAFLANLRDPEEPYNTRLRGGLPPTPIGNPGLSALEAAAEPVDSPYWYYLHGPDGKVRFGRNSAEHHANRQRYNVW